MKPQINIESLTSSGTTVTATAKYAHGLLPGVRVRVQNCNETAYNGTFTVTAVTNFYVFTFTALSTPSASPATGNNITVAPNAWYGAPIRVGMFDSQNGAFFEFDGQTLWVVRRSSTLQTTGTSALTQNSPTVTGTVTKFSSEFKPGDFVVIRGQSYIVQHITSDTSMVISPEYRGATATNCVISKTVDTRFAQTNWNIDRCDGTGASLYNINLARIQMLYMDYSWYGAGSVRFGFKNNRGEVIYCHRIINNNLNSNNNNNSNT
jgi:hypothetical protein